MQVQVHGILKFKQAILFNFQVEKIQNFNQVYW